MGKKYSKDKDRLRQAITADSRFAALEQRAGQVIKILTGSDFEIKKEEEETINMCKALEDLKEEGREEGQKALRFAEKIWNRNIS